MGSSTSASAPHCRNMVGSTWSSAADSRTLRRLTQPSNTWLPANSTVSGIETRRSSAWPRNRFVASEATRAPSTSAGMSTCSAEPS